MISGVCLRHPPDRATAHFVRGFANLCFDDFLYFPQPAQPAQFPPQLQAPDPSPDEGFAPMDHLPS